MPAPQTATLIMRSPPWWHTESHDSYARYLPRSRGDRVERGVAFFAALNWGLGDLQARWPYIAYAAVGNIASATVGALWVVLRRPVDL